MNNFVKNNYKDCSIINTVYNFKKILIKMGFDLSIEIKLYNGVYISKIVDKTTKLCSYGKGITCQNAVASGLGEFLERASFGMLASYPFFNYSYNNKHNEKVEFTLIGGKETLKIERFELFAKYRSTGMAAGNTYYEAFVQSCSEIFERYSQYLVFSKKIRAYCYNYESIRKSLHISREIQELIYKLKKENSYIYIIDIASCVGLPVVGIMINDINLKKYVFRFAAHPIFQMAVETCLLEFSQLGSYEEIFKYTGIDWFEESVEGSNLFELLTNGRGKFGICNFINNEVKFNIPNIFIQVEDVSNTEMFYDYYLKILNSRRWRGYYRTINYDCAVCIQIVIPGVSDIYMCVYNREKRKKDISDYSTMYIKKEISKEVFVDKVINNLIYLYDSNNNDFNFYRRTGIYNSSNDLVKFYTFLDEVKNDIKLNINMSFAYHKWEAYCSYNFVPIDENGMYKLLFEMEEALNRNSERLNL